MVHETQLNTAIVEGAAGDLRARRSLLISAADLRPVESLTIAVRTPFLLPYKKVIYGERWKEQQRRTDQLRSPAASRWRIR